MEETKTIDKRKQLEKGQWIALFSTLLILVLALVKAFVGYTFNSSLLKKEIEGKLSGIHGIANLKTKFLKNNLFFIKQCQ